MLKLAFCNKFDMKFVFSTRFVCLCAWREVAINPYAQPSVSYMVAARAVIITPVYAQHVQYDKC